MTTPTIDLKYGIKTPLVKKEKPNFDDLNLFIGTPAYNSMVHTDYLHSMIDFQKNKVPMTVMTIGNESLIPRGRNTVISYFHTLTDFSHLLYLDADIFLEFQAFMKLMSHEKDVIAAPVALKGFDDKGQPVYNTGKILKKLKDDLYTVDRVGTAVLILSRNATNALVKDAIDNNQIYKPNLYSRGDANPNIIYHYNVFSTGITDEEYDSEDFFICHKLIKLGFDIHLDPTVRVRHNGMFGFV